MEFVNAKAKAEQHPETFDRPSEKELQQVVVGSTVKVCTGGERFWCGVEEIAGNEVVATVDNDLICTDEHGLSFGDSVTFTLDNIYDIFNQ